jgi:hypothetical protein
MVDVGGLISNHVTWISNARYTTIFLGIFAYDGLDHMMHTF